VCRKASRTLRPRALAMNETAKVSTLIVDDEPLARAGLHHMLEEIEWIECIGEAANGSPRRIEAINTPATRAGVLGHPNAGTVRHGGHCTRAASAVSSSSQPHTRSTRSTAFELGALDYLLKPFGEDRLRAALERVRAAVGEPRTSAFKSFIQRSDEPCADEPPVHYAQGRSIVPLKVTDVTLVRSGR